ncbi:MAG: metallophosphoesterase family protein [Desulfuromusa sp.]
MNKQVGCLNLGQLSGRMLIFGGPYSNLAATQAMRQRAEELDIPSHQVVCTGDLIAYCAEPLETLQLVRNWDIAVVQGNCEESLGKDAPDCGCGFEEGTTCSLLSVGWYHYATQKIEAADRIWMRNLPRSLCFDLAGHSIMVIHGGVRQINRFIFPSTAEEKKRAELDLAGSDILIGGHSGIPYGQKIDSRAWLNAGVIGLPANDGTQNGWYLLLTPKDDHIHCSWQQLNYNAEQSHRNMTTAGLCGGYSETLLNGLWPSMDVLPAIEQSQRGQPLALPALIF